MIENFLAERRALHGDFEEYSACEQTLKDALRDSPGWESLPAVHRAAFDMICSKMARVLSGNPLCLDHFNDIIGYSQRVIEYLDNNPKAVDVRAVKMVRDTNGEWVPE